MKKDEEKWADGNPYQKEVTLSSEWQFPLAG